ncbi:hypothetical protein V2T44_06650 [Serratia ficaria]|uniref:hypothetical protein n=1 Tax=Serratia ficaria TaxID=61651 RepID=UPI002ED32921|nr:hypothetical protein [Serratia ficaria]
MIILLPRLQLQAAEQELDVFINNPPQDWKGFNKNTLPNAVKFAATGGVQITSKQLEEMRSGICEIAKRNGFGGNDSRLGFSKFDTEAAAWFADQTILASGEALRDDVWSFIGVVLAPDIVYWRFGNARKRYIGGVRNTFQRLWMRGVVFDRGGDSLARWELLEELTEDALVQITERPSLGGDPRLGRAIAEAWLRAARYYGKNSMEPIMRNAILRIRVWNEVRSFSSLSDSELCSILDLAFGNTAENGR